MKKLLIWALAGLMLFGGSALAVDDMWDDDDIIKEDPAYTGGSSDPVEVEASYPHAGAANQMGMFFGADGNFEAGNASGNVRDRSLEYNGQTIYFPEYGHSGNELFENVYGPMWGVPSDAVGLDGYDPYYYHMLTSADAGELSAEQIREIEERMRAGQQRYSESGEVVHESAEVVDESAGISMTDDYWD